MGTVTKGFDAKLNVIRPGRLSQHLLSSCLYLHSYEFVYATVPPD